MTRAKVNLICQKCKKEFTHIKHHLPNGKSRDNYENWAKKNITVCQECWKAEQEVSKQAERENQATENTKTALECPWILPVLEGSEKQIKWATDIRNNLIAQLAARGAKWDVMESVGKGAKPEGITEEAVNAMIEVYGVIYTTSSKWWIDNRGKTLANGIFEVGRGMR